MRSGHKHLQDYATTGDQWPHLFAIKAGYILGFPQASGLVSSMEFDADSHVKIAKPKAIVNCML